MDPALQAPRFLYAGNSHTYDPDRTDATSNAPPSFLARACSDASFMEGVLEAVIGELQEAVDTGGTVVSGSLAAVVALDATGVIAGATLAAVLAAFLVILAILAALLAFIRGLIQSAVKPTLGETLNHVRETLLNQQDPDVKAAGLMTWQCIMHKVFSSEQKDLEFDAISYAVMDRWDYLDKSCFVNVDSLEVFFDATDSMLTTYIDALLVYELGQEFKGRAFAGYLSLRFTGPTRALLGMQRYPLTCAVEVAGLRGVEGSQEFVDYAHAVALHPQFHGILHWGQRHDATLPYVQNWFGDTALKPSGSLRGWRRALSRITQNGKLDRFSNAFTRRTGLEIVMPLIQLLEADADPVARGDPIVLRWNCEQNPPVTGILLELVSPGGTMTAFDTLPLAGERQVPGAEVGAYTARLTASIELGGERREATQAITVTVT